MGFLEAAVLDPNATFSLANLITAIRVWVEYLFSSTGPIKSVITIVTENQILWMFLAFGICTIGISLLRRLRRLF